MGFLDIQFGNHGVPIPNCYDLKDLKCKSIAARAQVSNRKGIAKPMMVSVCHPYLLNNTFGPMKKP
jgi:hypothetical protein